MLQTVSCCLSRGRVPIFEYGWILVSAAIEAAADQPFLTFMREQIFQPLGMNDTGAESSTENPEHVGEPEEDAPLLTLVRGSDLAAARTGRDGQVRD